MADATGPVGSDQRSSAAGMPIGSSRRPMQVDIERVPFVVAWEITRACALACQHCRAEAQPRRHPNELSSADARRLIDEIADMGTPLLVLTGGDPMLRNDLPELIAHARSRRLQVALSPSATPRVTRARLEACRDAGVGRVSISLDGSMPQIHDDFRGFEGVFERTLDILDLLSEVGLTVQINTTVCRQNCTDLPAIAQLVAKHRAVMWSMFCLVPLGVASAAM